MPATHRKLVGLLVLTALSGCASWRSTPTHDPRAAAGEQAAAARDAQTDGAIESARSSVRSTAEWLARGVDSWFGDRPFEDGGSVRDGRLSVSLLKRQDTNADFDVRFNARFRLPNVEEKTYLFIGRDNPRDVITDRPGSFTGRERLLSETNEDRSFFAGLGRTISESTDFRLGLRGGLKVYAQARYRRPWQLAAADLAEFRQTLFWSQDDHLGSTTALSYEHAFSPVLASRWLGAATITQNSRKFEWHTSLGVYRSFGVERVLSLEALATGRQGSGVAVTDYGVQARWEQPVHRDWLLGNVIVGHFWPRPDATSERGRAWALGGGLKMRF
jgi:hypothetical protein